MKPLELAIERLILVMLGLIDAALVASLIVMVMISSCENFVSRFEDASDTKISWLGNSIPAA
jgi:uncharacterized protein (TIGR00645 family)